MLYILLVGANSAPFAIFFRKFLTPFRHCSVVRAVPIRLRHWLALLGRYHMGAICKIKNFDSAPSFPKGLCLSPVPSAGGNPILLP